MAKAQSNSEICVFCGGEITFRVINGKTTPLHVGASGCVGRKLYRKEEEGVPHYTKCPKCESNVIFLRHNGGSVWLEALGWPWPKHPCFVSPTPGKRFLPLAAESLKNPTFLYAHFIGRRWDKDGVVVLLRHDKSDFRRNPKYLSGHWVVECSERESKRLESLFKRLPVIVSFTEHQLISFEGEQFKIKAHGVNYYAWRKEPSGSPDFQI